MLRPGGLLERETELARLRELCGEASRGSGGVVAIQGSAGVGKTVLLDEAVVAGEQAGLRVLTASGAELEEGLPFGVVRQLFERLLRELGDHDGDGLLRGAAGLARPVVLDPPPARPRPEAAQAAMHGLYWLAAELAARCPVLIAIDDAHWADGPSLRWLAYLARRLDGLAATVVVACRDAEPGTDWPLLSEVLAEAHAGVLRPAPLSEAAVGCWLADAYDTPPAPVFVHECWTATGGNPLLLGQLAAELEVEGLASDAAAAERITGIAPATIGRSVLARLARLGLGAVAIAESAAILSADARLDRVAALAGLSLRDTVALTDALTESQIFAAGEPIRFAHPLVRAAVYDQIPSARRGLGHAAAAQCLLDDGAGVDRAATHFLLAPPSGNTLAVQTLRAAAAAALDRGAPDVATALLVRAAAEPPVCRADVLLELATAEATALNPAAVIHAREVIAGPSTPIQCAQAVLVAANAELAGGRIEQALEILGESALDSDTLDDATRLELRASAMMAEMFLSTADLESQLIALGADSLPGETEPQRTLLCLRSLDLHIRAQSRDHALDLARRVLANEDQAAPTHITRTGTCARVVAQCGHIEEAHDVLTSAIGNGQARGSISEAAYGYLLRSEVERYAGRLAEAEVDARIALDAGMNLGIWVAPLALAQLAEVLIERESPTVVLGLIEQSSIDIERLPPLSAINLLLHARGRAHEAAGTIDRAIDDFEACGRRQTEWGVISPTDIPWRSSLATAMHADGRTRDARRLADEELELARTYGVARAVGIAQRARALVGPGEAVITGLSEALETLTDSPARLECARVLVDLGAAQRRAGHRKQARETLSAGLDAAHRCGAHQLAARARAELRAAGARPRRERLAGPEALTASERRVAELAADGLTNRQIAQSLFVTTKTVEMHLGRVYPKLDITGRTELPLALGRPPGNDTAAPVRGSSHGLVDTPRSNQWVS